MIETTRRSTCRLNVIEEVSDFSEAAEGVDSESDKDLHVATWSAMNRLRSESTVYHRQNSKRFRYSYKIYSHKVGFVRLNLRTVPRFIRKKDGTMRMCVDYRKLKDLTRKDRTPLPRIDELLDSLYGAHSFSTLDMYKGYHQVRVK
jgi:hypothetical protein